MSEATTPVQRGWRQTMAWAHGWLGLIAGWILFTMFLTGTSAYFRPEITQWMQPEIRPAVATPAQAATSAVRHLARVGGDDLQWYIYLPDARTIATRVFRIPAKPDPKARGTELDLDPVSGAPLTARETRGGEHFYRFHFQLQLPYPWGRWLAGLCAMAMLGAIISGVITHKRIFADFFTLRWNKGQRSWLDAHNVTAVLGLPYHAMIAYTGLITLITMYMPYPIVMNYAKPAQFVQTAYGQPDDVPASGVRRPLVAIAPLIQDAERRLGGPATRVIVTNPGDAAARVTIAQAKHGAISAQTPIVVYEGATGRFLSRSGAPASAIQTAGVLLGLHLAQFAGPALRWAYFVMGLTGAAMVGTGLLLWTAKRRKPGAAPFFGLRLAERLNIAVIAAFPCGMAAYLLANRLIPAGMAGRADMEVSAMFWTWGLLALAQLGLPARRAWTILFGVAGLFWTAIPVVNALTDTRWLIPSLLDGDQVFLAFDLACLAIGAGFAVAARVSARPAARTPTRTRRFSEPAHA
ncbi:MULTISPECIES: PepSY-associated TM helix domain-containing protein [unclassified Sphingomonas]|uniref:PepSY-associated TM helix domain-containing protein n=1 Tax=unclassified Sphingomonas TaxID=196159 RepID=UPI002857B8F4|nr:MULTISPECIES: PepSY-associated TM helix domain-containing protein [unclassified Sphingomonas]MDR6114658.1 putative iron-regulated membrane protein [Sphingomonas sp. SORGH_AS_0789]MDR6151669.1 putative iron-regulated membrane protein [Sphingomonas sp. SORGH_AS_0742]